MEHSPMQTKPEPSPVEKFLAFGRKVVATPKAEIERREAEYQKGRKATRQQRKAGR